MKTLVLVFVLFVSVAQAQESYFQDVNISTPELYFATRNMLFTGITGGCSANPPLYCPEAPLTRGAFAIMLSIAMENARQAAFMDMIQFLQLWICTKDDGTLMDCRGGSVGK